MNADLLARPRVLVVDDQPINIQILYRALAAEFRVLKAGDGEEALQLCRRLLPDLVLLDVVMPGTDGHEVCRRLKADALTRDIPVIFVTAQDEASQEALGLELGAADFIAKPVNAAVVRARVKTHLGLARARSLLAATLEATADGILVTDSGGAVTGMNARFGRLWNIACGQPGAPGQRDIPARMEDQVADAGSYRRQLASALEGGAAAGGEVIELQGDRQLERHVTTLRVNGRDCGHVFSFRDVTERRRAAQQLQRLNETLESRIAERTRDLEQALRRADAASQAKSDFLSNMSHEIRTPMNAIIGMAWLALQGRPDPVLRGQLQSIHSAGRHLLGLVTDILDFSKIEAGKLGLESADFELAAVFAAVLDQLGAPAQAKGLALLTHIDPGLPARLRGDSQRIVQVLLNYVANAIKFSAAGPVELRAIALQADAGGCLLRFEVEDRGIGIAAEQIGQLFQPFHQADASTTRLYGGTGLGLAICKRLATLMGGAVGVRSRPGEGSCFWFSVRLDHAAEATPAAAAGPGAAVAACRDDIAGARILLVDDNEFNREVTAALLQHVGAAVSTAASGRQALDLLAAGPCDCVLMDVQMPEMDGLQTTRLLRAQPQLARLPVLALTANSGVEDRQRCLQAGMDDFMTKPVDPECLYAALARWLRRSRAGAAAAAPPDPAAAAPAARRGAADLSLLARAAAGHPDRLRRYAGLFVEMVPETLAEIAAALAAGDLPRLADLGHRLKSSARMVGALELARLSEALERFRDAGTVDEASAVAAQMPLMLEQLRADIQGALA